MSQDQTSQAYIPGMLRLLTWSDLGMLKVVWPKAVKYGNNRADSQRTERKKKQGENRRNIRRRWNTIRTTLLE